MNWIIPKDTLGSELNKIYDTTQWWVAEAIAQCNKWAEDNKGDIPSIADEKVRYEAIITKVCDFLTYDDAYYNPHIAYTIRDGKGVCGDYTTLTAHLCQACGITAEVSIGAINGVPHDMLKVTLNGQTYYSDPTNYDAGSAPMLSEGVPSYYVEDTILPDAGEGYTGADTDDTDSVLNLEASKQGMAILAVNSTGTYYGSLEDVAALDNAYESGDYDTAHAILDKYGVPYAK